ncbi:uncharacterized protein KY384_006041 [Bacidia gigantensis]|uniref:uncharacterized protein n=1 Tax=Bacidia gigantensis TaxID=2732470 RepID=UPI001D04B847|nr:uncharacterized protein KY384_006041 [Bacidia gigantensis]KAG8529404.1 hypothetical protein KY384_006041 [Bacidia gigantensis]
MAIWPFTSSDSSSTSPAHEPPTPSSDGAYIAPDRISRKRCWEARDRFFDCLEQNGIVDSLKEKDRTRKTCGKEDEELGRECVASWVTYFKQRRVMEHNKKTTLEKLAKEGAEKISDKELPPNLPRGKPPS